MTELKLADAIRLLKPDSQFSFINCDYSTIKWDKLEGDAPTLAEVNAAVEQVKINAATAAAAKESEKADLLAKLGITEDEAKLLLG